MANVKISGIAGGAKASPVGTDLLEIEESGGTSYYATLANLTKGLDAATVSAQGAMSASDKSKLDGIESSADVTDEANVTNALDGATLTAATVAGTDKVLMQDADDSDILKTATAQSIADLSSGTARKFTTVSTQSTGITLASTIANNLILASNTITLTLPSSLDDGVGASFVVANVGTGTVTISAGTEGINRAGNDSIDLAQDSWVEISYASASDPKWAMDAIETVNLGANQAAYIGSDGSTPEARTDKRPLTGSVETDANGDHYLGFLGFAADASNVRARTISGTCDVVFKKNGTAINGFGSAVSLTSTASDTASTESFAQDDLVSVTISNASTLTGIIFSVEMTRTAD